MKNNERDFTLATTSNRKTSTKTAVQKGLTAGVVGTSAGDIWQPSEYQIRQTALDIAVRVIQSGSDTKVLIAAEKFYAFLTSK